MCRTVRALQCNLLEVEAFLVYERMKRDDSPLPSLTRTTIGVFVYTIHDMINFTAMGVPNWLIRPFQNAMTSRIGKVVTICQPEDMGISNEPSPLPSPIFLGCASDPAMYLAIHNHSNKCLRFPDPFHAHALPETLSFSSGPVRSAHKRQRALTAKQRAKKFASPRKF